MERQGISSFPGDEGFLAVTPSAVGASAVPHLSGSKHCKEASPNINIVGL